MKAAVGTGNLVCRAFISFIHSFNKQLMSSDSVPGTRVTAGNKTVTALPFPQGEDVGLKTGSESAL